MNKESNFSIGIQAKLKHGALMKAIEKRGWSQAEAARFLGIDNGTFGKWINMKVVPNKLSNDVVKKLYELTWQTPEELWPEEVFTPEFLDSPRMLKHIREVPVHLLATFGIIPALPAPRPDQSFEQGEFRNIVDDVLNKLPEREREVLKARFFDGETLEEVARTYHVSKNRISQIEKKALRTLRHPSRTAELKEYA